MDRNKIITTASAEIGYREGQNNNTKYGEWFGLQWQSWCCIFCMWVLDKCGYSFCADFLKGWASVPSIWKYAVANGCTTNNPKPGDLVIYDWNADSRQDHIGIVVSNYPSNVAAVEGNTGDSNWSNGEGVYQRIRAHKFVTGYIDIEKLYALKGVHTVASVTEAIITGVEAGIENMMFGTVNYKIGNSGEMVKRIQTALNAYYPDHSKGLKVDGDFGPETLKFVKAFQEAHGLKIDGIVGPDTLKALGL